MKPNRFTSKEFGNCVACWMRPSKVFSELKENQFPSQVRNIHFIENICNNKINQFDSWTYWSFKKILNEIKVNVFKLVFIWKKIYIFKSSEQSKL